MAEERQEGEASAPTFDLVKTLYQALQGAAFAMRAQEDARKAGDSELVALFAHAQDMHQELGERARGFLLERLGAQVHAARMPPRNLEARERDAEGRQTADAVEEASMESFPASDAPAY